MRRIFGSSTILLLAFAAAQTIASAQETPGIEGVWFGVITPVDCQTRMPTGASPFHALYMYGHDGSLTNESANQTPTAPRSSAVGHWQHTQAQNYTGTFRFFNYNPDGSFMLLRKVTLNIALGGDQYTSFNQVQDFDWYNNAIPGSARCNIVRQATRIQ
jgi:hypothetical protein